MKSLAISLENRKKIDKVLSVLKVIFYHSCVMLLPVLAFIGICIGACFRAMFWLAKLSLKAFAAMTVGVFLMMFFGRSK